MVVVEESDFEFQENYWSFFHSVAFDGTQNVVFYEQKLRIASSGNGSFDRRQNILIVAGVFQEQQSNVLN